MTGDRSARDPAAPGAADAFLRSLVADGLLDRAASERVRRTAERAGETVTALLLRMGYVPEGTLAAALARQFGLPLPDPATCQPCAVEGLGPRFLAQHRLVPLADDGRALTLGTADPFDRFAVQAVEMITSRRVQLAILPGAAIDRALAGAPPAPLTEAPEGPRPTGLTAVPAAAPPPATAALEAGDAGRLHPAARLLDRLVEAAADAQASDLHLEPSEGALLVRLRVDGRLQPVETVPPELAAPLIGRLKVRAGLDVAEARLPQDGRFTTAARGQPLELRVSLIPTPAGESAVLRLLDRARTPLALEALGMAPEVRTRLERALARPDGLLLVTGPVGQGKTTTLYAALSRLARPQVKLVTVEDPVEMRVPGAVQSQVNPAIGLDFGRVLRHALRHDPNVLMIGEIRDADSAGIAVQAALTGHLVLSTLHTDSAPATALRLLDMGIEPFLLAATLSGVLGQRLLRRVCPDCAVPAPADAATRAWLEAVLGPATPGVGGEGLRRAVGCPACAGQGVRGRALAVEWLAPGPALRAAIAARADLASLEAAARGEGWRPLLEDALRLALAGVVPLEEALALVRAD